LNLGTGDNVTDANMNLGTGTGNTDVAITLSGGTGSSTITHDGDDDFILDNTGTTNSTIVRLGNTDGSTAFRVQNDSDVDQFVVPDNGNATLAGTLDV
jgi:hypothetical protein